MSAVIAQVRKRIWSIFGVRIIVLTETDRLGTNTGKTQKGPVFWQESMAQHRFPVWWTGDGVSLQASVESMVHAGVHDFKPYVHSDWCATTQFHLWAPT